MVDAGVLALLAGLLSGLIGLMRSVVPGLTDEQGRIVAVIGAVVLVGLAFVTARFSGDVLQALGLFIALASGAVGIHETVPLVPGVKRLSTMHRFRK